MKPQLMAKSSLEYLTFKVIILQFIASTSVPHMLVKGSLIVYMLIVFQSSCARIDLFAILAIQKRAFAHMGNIASIAIGLVYLGLQLSAFWLYRKIDQQAKTPLLIHLLAHLDPILVYVVFPLQLWSLITTMYLFPTETGYIGCGIAGLTITTLEVCLILSVMRNTMPCRSFMACIDSSHEIPMLLISTIVMVLGLTQQYDSKELRNVIFQAIICVFNLMQFTFFSTTPKYWLPEANKWFMTIYAILLLGNTWNLLLDNIGGQKSYFVLLFLAFPWLLKTNGSLLRYLSTYNFLDNTKSSVRRIQSIMALHRTFHSRLSDNQTPSPDLIYYEGILSDHLRHQGKSDQDIQKILSDDSEITKILIEAISEETNKIEFWTLSTCLWMTVMVDHFLGVRSLVAKCKAQLKANRNTTLVRLKQQHFITLIENKLDAIFLERVDWAKMKNMSIDSVYKSFSEKNSDASAALSIVNIEAPLKLKDLFLELVKEIRIGLTTGYQVYEYILEKRDRSSKLKTSEILSKNYHAISSRDTIKKLLSTQLPEIKHLPKYFFPILYMYNSTLCHNCVKAKKLLSQYKKKTRIVSSLQINTDSSSRKSNDNIQRAYFRIGESQRGVNGYIKDCTTNLSSLVGSTPDGKLVGRHIHDFFLSCLIPLHEVMMNSSERIMRVVGVGVPFFVMRFDGFLKRISVMVKASSSLVEGLEYYGELSDMESPLMSLVVLADDMEVLGSEPGFVKGIKHMLAGRQMSKAGLISAEIPLMFKLLQLLNRMDGVFHREGIKPESGSLLDNIIDFGKAVVSLNSEGKIVYCLDNTDYNGGKDTRALKFACQLESASFGSKSLIKMLVNFGISSAHYSSNGKGVCFSDTVTRLREIKNFGLVGTNQRPAKHLKRMNYIKNGTADNMKDYQPDFNHEPDTSSIFLELSCLLWNISEATLRSYPNWVRLFAIDLQDIIASYEHIFDSSAGVQLHGTTATESPLKSKMESIEVVRFTSQNLTSLAKADKSEGNSAYLHQNSPRYSFDSSPESPPPKKSGHAKGLSLKITVKNTDQVEIRDENDEHRNTGMINVNTLDANALNRIPSNKTNMSRFSLS